MGKESLGNIIRRIDYQHAKGQYEYKSGENPYDLLENFGKECDGLSFNEWKDAWKALEQKVCVSNYPERNSPQCKLAVKTADILLKHTKSLLENNNELRGQISEILFQLLLSLIKAGPGSSHCEIMEKINCKALRPPIEGHIQTLDRKGLVHVMSVTKVKFSYTPNDQCTAERLGLSQRGQLVDFFKLFTPEQLNSIMPEFLDVYKYYHLQLPGIVQYTEYSKKICFLIDEMVEKFERKNPFMNVQDPEILRHHLNVVKDLVCNEHFNKDGPLHYAARKLLIRIIAPKDLKYIIKELFDNVLDFLWEISKNANATQNSDGLVYVLQDSVFRKIENAKIKVSIRTPERILDIIISALNSGRNRQMGFALNLLKLLKTAKAIDWKNRVKEAKHMIEIIGEIPRDRIQDDGDCSLRSTFREYKSFLEELLQQLQKSKVMSQLKKTMVELFFNCMLSDPGLKAEIGEDCIGKDNLDLAKEKDLRLYILQKVKDIVKNEEHPWENMYFHRAIKRILVLVVESYSDDGSSVTKEENDILMSIFKQVSEGCDSVEDQFYEEDRPETRNWKLNIFQVGTNDYMRVCPKTYKYVGPLMCSVLRWARIAHEEKHEDMMESTLGTINYLLTAPPKEFSHLLPEVLDLMMTTKKTSLLFGFVSTVYPDNPKPVHDRIDNIYEMLDSCKEDEQRHLAYLLNTVAQHHPEVFKKQHIDKMFERYNKGFEHEKYLVLMTLKSIAEKFPDRLVEFFPRLCEDGVYKKDVTTVTLRCGIIACVGSVNQKLGEKAVDQLIKYIDNADVTVAQVAIREIDAMAKPHQAYLQKYKKKFQRVEQTSTVPQIRDAAHEIILILEGKSVENIAEDVQQQQEDIAVIDEKVGVTMNTVIGIGDKVIEHDKEIGQLGEGLERVEERVDVVEEDLGETKIKVEEIDNKTMTNAPKWSRDLTKLMNPVAENDWRLLASRLGYTNDDIRGWATQHDPCMALLSEWYATHKTSEASYGVLTALTEMNRLDGAAIVENAMKQAEGVVEDEEFEYPSPPPVFISYQWGFQNEVKLLKKHLNMAGYECWLDVGQMGGGDKLFAKIDNGIRGAKIVICCVTEKYAKSPNCNREVNLSVNLNKPIIPLLMEKMDWPPKGSMGPIFSEYLFIRFFQRGGEETPDNDQRYWPIPKFQELLMQLNFFVVPDQKMVQKIYARWWAPIVEDIVIDKNRGKSQPSKQNPRQLETQVTKKDDSPSVFLSYQWGKQPQIKALYQRLTSLGYTVWMDIYQMGGGDSLYDKIDRGMRGCMAVVSCVTQKYSLSANCRREVSLADALKKPIIPLLLEQIKWPPDGPMSMVFTELLYINFYRDEAVQMTWIGDQFDELRAKLGQFLPGMADRKVENKKKDGAETKTVEGGTRQKKSLVINEGNDQSGTANKEELGKTRNQQERKEKDPTIQSKSTSKSVSTPTSKDESRMNKHTNGIASKESLNNETKTSGNKQDPSQRRVPVSKAASVGAFKKKTGTTDNNQTSLHPGNQNKRNEPVKSDVKQNSEIFSHSNEQLQKSADPGRNNSSGMARGEITKVSPRKEQNRTTSSGTTSGMNKSIQQNSENSSHSNERLQKSADPGRNNSSGMARGEITTVSPRKEQNGTTSPGTTIGMNKNIQQNSENSSHSNERLQKSADPGRNNSSGMARGEITKVSPRKEQNRTTSPSTTSGMNKSIRQKPRAVSPDLPKPAADQKSSACVLL